ncbi:MAG: hypothetical protein KDB00_29330 [Planctomycetales bacterium]|nr:hypothetical protein [Planctomycetales bacterium]
MTIDWDLDSTSDQPQTVTLAPGSRSLRVPHTYAQSKSYRVQITVQDSTSANAGTDSKTIDNFTVNNSPPTSLASGGPYVIRQGDSLRLDGFALDAPLDLSKLQFFWDIDLNQDGDFLDPNEQGVHQLLGLAADPDLQVPWTTLQTWGIATVQQAFTLRMRVFDDGNYTSTTPAPSVTTTLRIENELPSLAFVDPTITEEGTPITLQAIISGDPIDAAAGRHSITWQLSKDGAALDTTTFSGQGTAQIQWTPTDDGIYSATIEVDDGFGVVTATRILSVRNQAPQIGPLSGPLGSASPQGSVVELGNLIPISGSATDPAVDDRGSLRTRLNIVRLSSSTTATELQVGSGESFDTSLSFDAGGTYTVSAVTTDDEGAESVSTPPLTFHVPGVELTGLGIGRLTGWTVEPNGQLQIDHVADGGVDDGYMVVSESFAQTVSALNVPTEITANLIDFDGSLLQFDAKLLSTAVSDDAWGILEIEGTIDGITRVVVADVGAPNREWTTYRQRLQPSDWEFKTSSPSEDKTISGNQWRTLLSNAHTIRLGFDADIAAMDRTGIDNVSFTPALVEDFALYEADTANFRLDLTELAGVSESDVLGMKIAWGDQTETSLDPAQISLLAIGNPLSIEHNYRDNGHFTVIVKLNHRVAGELLAGRTSVTILNESPKVATPPAFHVNEGSAVELSLTDFSDASPIDSSSLRFSFDFNNDGDFADLGEVFRSSLNTVTIPGSFLAVEPQQTIRIRIEDKDGGSVETEASVEITNVAPSISLDAHRDAIAGVAYVRELTIVDPGKDAPWTIFVDWNGDGDDSDQVIRSSSRNVTLTHVFGNDLVGQTIPVSLRVVDRDGGSVSESLGVSVTTAPLSIESLEPNPSGFTLTFNRPIDVSRFNLYDSALSGGTVDPSDLVVLDGSSQPVRGSAIIDEDGRHVRFIKTGGILSDMVGGETFTVVLNSGPNSIVDTQGGLLDGNGDETVGDPYTNSFDVDYGNVRIISVGDIVRAPGQPIDLTPADTTDISLPIRINNADGVLAVTLDLVYEPTLLAITAVSLADNLAIGPAGWNLESRTVEPGRLRLYAWGTEELSEQDVALFSLTASVASDAPYGASGAIEIIDVSVNSGQIETVGDIALQKTSLLGDATGDRSYSGLDASLVARVYRNELFGDSDTGFDNYPLVDPHLIGAIANDKISNADPSLLARAVVGYPVPELPQVPNGLAALVQTGVDPTVTLSDTYAIAGGKALVTATIDNTQTGLLAFDFRINYDASKLSLDPSAVRLAEQLSGWILEVKVDNDAGTLTVSASSAEPVTELSQVLLNIEFDVAATAIGTAFVQLDTNATTAQQVTISRLNEGRQTLTGQDGQVTILPDIAPQIEDIVINDGGVSRSQITSITIHFNTLLDRSTLETAFELTNTGSGISVGNVVAIPFEIAGKTVVKLTFSGASTSSRIGIEGQSTSLDDGNYRLRVRAQSTRNAVGTLMASDFLYGEQAEDLFFRLFGDTDGDRDVDGQDYGRFGLSFMKSSGNSSYNSDLDSDGDGDVDGQDYGRFDRNFLRHL